MILLYEMQNNFLSHRFHHEIYSLSHLFFEIIQFEKVLPVRKIDKGMKHGWCELHCQSLHLYSSFEDELTNRVCSDLLSSA